MLPNAPEGGVHMRSPKRQKGGVGALTMHVFVFAQERKIAAHAKYSPALSERPEFKQKGGWGKGGGGAVAVPREYP